MLPPGPPSSRLAQTLAFGARPAEFLEDAQRRHGDAFTMRIAHEGEWVVLSDPAAVREVYGADPGVARAGEANAFLRPLLGPRSLILLDGDEHLRHRRALTPALHGERLRALEPIMREVARDEVARWRGGQTLSVLERMQAIALDVVLRAVLGLEEERELRRARRVARRLLWLSTWPPAMATIALIGYRAAGWHPSLLLARRPVRRLIERRIAAARGADGTGGDVLSQLLDSGLDDRELRDELLTLVVAGHDTTAIGLAWTIGDVARQADGFARLRAGDAASIDAVIEESLRRHPVVPLVGRRLAAPLTVGGYELPAGATAVACTALVQDRRQATPFGGGTRRCVGAAFALTEMRVVLEEIAARVTLEPLDRAPDRPRRRAHMLAPENGVRARVHRI